MKIGIILNPYGEACPAGLARTIFEFTRELLDENNSNEYFIFVKGNKPRPDFSGGHWYFVNLGSGRFWLEGLRKYPQLDVCIFNTPVLPPFYRPKKSLTLALDFAYLVLPASSLREKVLRQFTFWYHRFSLNKSDLIVAISQATKYDLVKFFGIPENKIKVIYCGFKKICAVAEKQVSLPARFFLFVGVVKERKNVFSAIQAFNLFNQEVDGYSFVVAGRDEGPYYQMIRTYLEEKKLTDKVLFLSHCDDGELSFVYRRAEALVFPSLVEGFGFPVLEAMDCGIPVITSKTTSLGEIAGDAAVLVDPSSAAEISNAMTILASDAVLRQDLIKKGLERAKKFSWEKAARGLLKVIEETA